MVYSLGTNFDPMTTCIHMQEAIIVYFALYYESLSEIKSSCQLTLCCLDGGCGEQASLVGDTDIIPIFQAGNSSDSYRYLTLFRIPVNPNQTVDNVKVEDQENVDAESSESDGKVNEECLHVVL